MKFHVSNKFYVLRDPPPFFLFLAIYFLIISRSQLPRNPSYDERLFNPSFHRSVLRSFELTLRTLATRVTYDYRERIGYIAIPRLVADPYFKYI